MHGDARAVKGAGAARRALLLAGLVAASALAPLPGLEVAPSAEATHAVELVSAVLPTGVAWPVAVGDGETAYIFGNGGSNPRQVLRYHAPTNNLTVANALLPYGLSTSTGVWAGDAAYLFGGIRDGGPPTRGVLRYDPVNDTVATMDALLPEPLRDHMAAWNGTHAFLFGGHNGTGPGAKKWVLRYDPAADKLTKMAAELPEGLHAGAAVSDGKAIYILGGLELSESGAQSVPGRVLRYDPATDTLVPLVNPIPPRWHQLALYDGAGAIYLYGGEYFGTYFTDILRYQPSTETWSQVAESLPNPRIGLSGAWLGDAGYLFGGHRPHIGNDATILRFDRSERLRDVYPRLPSGRSYASAVLAGDEAYVFGGVGLNDVVRFDVRSHTVTPVDVVLQPGRGQSAAVWSGFSAFLFGGFDGGSLYDQVVQFVPRTGQLSVMGDRLEMPLANAAAIWDGRNAYVFGGRTHPGDDRGVTGLIQRYDPIIDAFSTMGPQLPARSGLTALWDPRDRPGVGCSGGCAYLFGGYDGVQVLDDIYQYNPTLDRLTRKDARLPVPGAWATAVWDGEFAYVMGGETPFGPSSRVVRYDPGNETRPDRALNLSVQLPGARSTMASVFDGADAWLFGGWGSADIWRYNIRPSRQHAPGLLLAPVPAVECVGGGGTVQLDAGASYDPNGDPLIFAWEGPPGVSFADPLAAVTTARVPVGTTTLHLNLSDPFETVQDTVRAVVFDTLPPSTTVAKEGTPGVNGWWTSNVTIHLDPQDQCGIDYVSWGISSCGCGGTSLVVNATGDGFHEFAYSARDLAGNLEPWTWSNVSIDGTPPVAELVDPQPQTVYLEDSAFQPNRFLPNTTIPRRLCIPFPVLGCRELPAVPQPSVPAVKWPLTLVVGQKTVRAVASDPVPGSGVAYVEFWVDGRLRDVSAPTEGNYSFLWQAGEEALGNHTLLVRAYDGAGNSHDASMNVTTVPNDQDGVVATPSDCRINFSPGVCAAAGGDPRPLLQDLQSRVPRLEELCPLTESLCETLFGALMAAGAARGEEP